MIDRRVDGFLALWCGLIFTGFTVSVVARQNESTLRKALRGARVVRSKTPDQPPIEDPAEKTTKSQRSRPGHGGDACSYGLNGGYIRTGAAGAGPEGVFGGDADGRPCTRHDRTGPSKRSSVDTVGQFVDVGTVAGVPPGGGAGHQSVEEIRGADKARVGQFRALKTFVCTSVALAEVAARARLASAAARRVTIGVFVFILPFLSRMNLPSKSSREKSVAFTGWFRWPQADRRACRRARPRWPGSSPRRG